MPVTARKICEAYQYHDIYVIKEMLEGKDKLINVSIHEALSKQLCKFFIDIDCSKDKQPEFWNKSE